jgi:hypothetical protein
VTGKCWLFGIYQRGRIFRPDTSTEDGFRD